MAYIHLSPIFIWGPIIVIAAFFLYAIIVAIVGTTFIEIKEHRSISRKNRQLNSFFEECLNAGITNKLDEHRHNIPIIGKKYHIAYPEQEFDRMYKARFEPKKPLSRETKMKIGFSVIGAVLPILMYVIVENAIMKGVIPFPVWLLLSGMFTVIGYYIADGIHWKEQEEPEQPELNNNQCLLLSYVPDVGSIRRSELLKKVEGKLGKGEAKRCYDSLIAIKQLYETKYEGYYYTSRTPI